MATDATLGVEKYMATARLREFNQRQHKDLVDEVNRLWHENQSLKKRFNYWMRRGKGANP